MFRETADTAGAMVNKTVRVPPLRDEHYNHPDRVTPRKQTSRRTYLNK